MIAVFLALNLDEKATLTTDTDAPNLKEEELVNLAADIARMSEEVKALQKLPGDDEGTLRRSIEALKASVMRLSADAPADQTPVEGSYDRELQIEKQKLLTQIEELKKSQDENTRRITDLSTEMTDAENQIKDAESRLLQSRDRKNVLKLVPERSDTSKEPVLVLVQQPPWIIQRFDGGSAVSAYSIGEMLEALEPLTPSTHYLVFYFKPSGSLHFKGVTNRARLRGYEIGYDFIPENIQFEFDKK